MTIWTIGHSDRSKDALSALLQEYEIDRVVDVRSSPWSRRHPWHGRSEMESALREISISYSWLGAGLGGLRRGDYLAHQKSESYREAIEQVLAAMEHERVAILCAEREPWGCHRRHIADDLVRRGISVLHIITPGQVAAHQNLLDLG